jgi:hypothetical protein
MAQHRRSKKVVVVNSVYNQRKERHTYKVNDIVHLVFEIKDT